MSPTLSLGLFGVRSKSFKACKIMSNTPRKWYSSSSSSDDDVVFEVRNGTGLITLNRPKALNALNLSMIRKIHPKIKEWQEQRLKAILIEGAGEKAFCAGGDIRAITKVKGSQEAKDFFREEYHLNNLTSTCGLPYVALIDGICMGGGVGLSVHGDFRVCTEKTVFAMPETGIGLVPDVGGGYFLPRMRRDQPHLGMFFALTGHRIKGFDCLHAGVATHSCPSDQISQLKEDLIAESDSRKIADVLDVYTEKCPKTTFSLQDKLPMIEKCFSKNSVEEIMAALEAEGGDWGRKLSSQMAKMSPTSMKVTFRQLKDGGRMSNLAEVLNMEYRLVRRCAEDDDFFEGVRAVLVERDNAPKWRPDSIDKVGQEVLERYFSKLADDQELKLE